MGRGRKHEQFCTVPEEQMSEYRIERTIRSFAQCEQFWRLYEHLRDSVHNSNDRMGLCLDCFSCDRRVDSYSSRRGRGVAHFALRPWQTRGAGPAH